MKRYSFLIFISLFIYACGNNDAGEQESVVDSALIRYNWEATDTGKLVITKKDGSGPDTLSPEAVVAFLNNKWPHVQLTIIKTSGDTVFLKIPQATYLTQQMGSTGPVIYFAEAVYNLTEIPGIHFVNFDFEEGDHAQPGIYNRDSFKNE